MKGFDEMEYKNNQNKKRRKEIDKKKRKIGGITGMLLAVVVFTAGLFMAFGDFSQAAPEDTTDLIVKDNFDRTLSASTTTDMQSGSMTLRLANQDGTGIVISRYSAAWTVTQGANLIELTPVQGTNDTSYVITAKQAGDVALSIIVKDNKGTADKSDDTMQQIFCNIHVSYSISTADAERFYTMHSTDIKQSLVLNQSEVYQLELTFGSTSNTTWFSRNNEVVTVDKNTGKVTAVAAGKTQVTASYQAAAGENYEATVDVYVLPKISAVDDSDFTSDNYKKNPAISLKSGEHLYTNTSYVNGTEIMRSKISWVITQDDGRGNEKKIADSFGLSSDAIELIPENNSNALRVRGLAGNYKISFYAYDTYDETKENGTVIAQSQSPSVVDLTILTDVDDTDKTLNIGDSYNFAEAWNMTEADFTKYFNVAWDTVLGTSGVYTDYVKYTSSTASFVTLKEGDVVATIGPKDKNNKDVKKLLGLTEADDIPSFSIKFHILDRVELNASSLTISVGQSYQLTPRLNGTFESSSMKWESSDPKTVSVTEDGLIKGLAVTNNKAVTITFTLDRGNGVYRTATCLVTVEAAVDSFTLSPNADQQMLAGEHLVVKAELKQAVTIAPLEWLSTDEKVFTVEQATDGKTATITAVAGGRADLMVYNTVNRQYKIVHITVRVAIDSIAFKSASISRPLYEKGYNLHDEVTYTPANATDSTLLWSSNNTSVVTVSKDGYLTFVGAGTAMIQVTPEYNPYNVMATCIINVQGTPTSMTVSKSDVVINVGESATLDVIYSPVNTATELTWTPNDKNIVKIEYNSEKQIATLTGLKAGTTNINVVSKEGMISNVNVTVKQGATDVKIDQKDLVLITGQTRQLTATLTPSGSTDTLKWESDDTKVVTVDANGLITAVAPGSTYVFVTAYNGSLQTCFARVAVTVRDAVAGITLPQSEYTMTAGDVMEISPTITPATAYNAKVTWEASNTNIVEIGEVKGSESDVKVTALAAGSVMLTATTEDGGYRASCIITVTAAETPQPSATAVPTATPGKKVPTKVKVTPSTKFLKLGKTFYVKAAVTGSTKNKKVKWTTSNKKICTVTQSGKVKGKKIGTATITATARDGSGAKGKCRVRVVRAVKKMTIKPASTTILVGKLKKLKVSIKPKNATIKKVTWSTADASIATVDENGKVLGVAAGIVQIRAKAKDGSGKTARCYVTVKEAVEATGVTVANSEITVAKGRAVQSGIVAAPANTTTAIRYYSDNKKVATVDSKGKIRTYRVGQATIYGETANGLSGYCDVLVVDLNRKGLVMRQYDKEQLRVNQISTGVTWYSKDINIATVDNTGLVTGRKKGTTIIYANVNGVKLGCRVTVKKIK